MGWQDKQDNYFLKKKAQKEGIEDASGPTPGSAYSEMSREDYTKAIQERNASSTPAVSAPAAQGATSAMSSPAASQAAQAVGSGDGLGALGGGLMAAGAVPSPASPYLMAAGLGVQVLASGEANKRAERERQRVEYNERIARRQEMMNNIAKMGIQ